MEMAGPGRRRLPTRLEGLRAHHPALNGSAGLGQDKAGSRPDPDQTSQEAPPLPGQVPLPSPGNLW